MQASNSSKGKILIADDEKAFAEGLADLLRKEGYECLTVLDSGTAAAELNTNPQYDLLIADVRMPGNEKLTLVEHLPSIAEGLPVILVTAYPEAADAVKSAQLPVLSYLPKMVEFPELLPHVRRAIAYSAIYRANKKIAQRLQRWSGDVQMLQQLLAKQTSLSEVAPEAFVKDTLREVMGCIADLQLTWTRVTESGATHAQAVDGQGDALDAALRALRSAFDAFPA